MSLSFGTQVRMDIPVITITTSTKTKSTIIKMKTSVCHYAHLSHLKKKKAQFFNLSQIQNSLEQSLWIKTIEINFFLSSFDKRTFETLKKIISLSIEFILIDAFYQGFIYIVGVILSQFDSYQRQSINENVGLLFILS